MSIDWVILGTSVTILIATIWLARRANVLFRRVREFETRLTELSRGLGEEVGEKISVENQALREEVAGRLGSVQACVDRMGTIEEDLRATVERGAGSPDREAVAEAVRPLIREAVDSLDSRLRQLEEGLRAAGRPSPDAAVLSTLAERGFTDVIVARESMLSDGRMKVIVEARRDGMTFKGPVVLDGDRVVEQRLTPSYPMFP